MIDTRTEELYVGEQRVVLWTHWAVDDPSMHLLHVAVNGEALVFSGDTRGEAMLEAAEFLQDLAGQLKRLAFEQEGAVKLR